MALLYAPQKKQKTTQKIVAEIQDLDYQGLGVAKIQGKTWFIENALPKIGRASCRERVSSPV